jgi:hypothetical protein
MMNASVTPPAPRAAISRQRPRGLRPAAAFLGLMLIAAPAVSGAALAQAQPASPAQPYQPRSGQAGKDVVWVPSPQALVDRMLDMAKLTPADYLIDLGSGDGRTVITAAKRGARAHGIEYNADLVALSQQAAQKEGVQERATFVRADIFESDFSEATVLTLFLLPQLNLRLRPIILDMKPGTRVVSNTFTMGEWKPDETIDAGGDCTSYCRAHRWIVPAQVEGRWRLPDGELSLEQRFQFLTGTMKRDGRELPLSEARLDGAQISFSAGGQRYTGRVNQDRIEGSGWSATRIDGG